MTLELVVVFLNLALGPAELVFPTNYYSGNGAVSCAADAREIIKHVDPEIMAISFCRERLWTDV